MVVLLFYVVFCLAFAHHDAVLTEGTTVIHHARNSWWHLPFWVAGGVVCWVTRSWWLMPCYPFVGRLFFDTMLNVWRGLPIGYVSPWVKAGDPRSSRIDIYEYHLFKSGITPKVLYFLIITILIYFDYVKH